MFKVKVFLFVRKEKQKTNQVEQKKFQNIQKLNYYNEDLFWLFIRVDAYDFCMAGWFNSDITK